MTDVTELLKKEPLKKDFVKQLQNLSHSSLVALATGLEVKVNLTHNAEVEPIEKLVLIYDAWMRLYNDVTWGKLLAVCDDYPNELGRAKAKLTDFLLSKKAHEEYLQETLENPYGRKKNVCSVSVQILKSGKTKSVTSRIARKKIATSISKKPIRPKNERQDKNCPKGSKSNMTKSKIFKLLDALLHKINNPFIILFLILWVVINMIFCVWCCLIFLIYLPFEENF